MCRELLENINAENLVSNSSPWAMRDVPRRAASTSSASYNSLSRHTSTNVMSDTLLRRQKTCKTTVTGYRSNSEPRSNDIKLANNTLYYKGEPIQELAASTTADDEDMTRAMTTYKRFSELLGQGREEEAFQQLRKLHGASDEAPSDNLKQLKSLPQNESFEAIHVKYLPSEIDFGADRIVMDFFGKR